MNGITATGDLKSYYQNCPDTELRSGQSREVLARHGIVISSHVVTCLYMAFRYF